MMTHVRFPGAWRLLIVALFLAILTTAMLAPTRPLNAQNSPLPTPTAGAQAPSPLSSPTPEEAPTSPLPTPGAAAQTGQPVSNTVATTAPTVLAGAAMTSPGVIVAIVLAALVMVGGVVCYRQRNR